MPSRRPSTATTVPASASIASSSRAHKSQDSNYGFNQSHHSLGNSAMQQQKIVQVLVNRLKNKLPCHSGTTLDRLESDKATQEAVDALVKLSHDSLDTIAMALCELVERLGKLEEGELTLEVLQSQLFVLKVLATAMSSRYHQPLRSGSRASSRNPGSAPDSPIPPSSSKWSRQSSLDHSPSLHLAEPAPMEDNVARYMLSVMVLFLRQSAHTDGPLLMASLDSSDVTFRDFETLPSLSISELLESQDSSPQHPGLPRDLRSHASSNSVRSGKQSVASVTSLLNNTTYERTPISMMNSPQSLNALIEKFTGKIIFHISASNWNVVFSRVRVKIRTLAQNDGDMDSIDLQLLSHSVLDRSRLVQVLSELSSLLVSMTGETHVAFATPLRLAIWNWISHFPEEYNDIVRGNSKLDGAPERVFDHLFARIKLGSERQMWPALTALLCITPDRISSDLYSGQRKKSGRFLEEIQKQLRGSGKHQDVGLVVALDLCRAAMYITPDPHDDPPLRSLASDIVHELKSSLFQSTHAERPFWDPSTEVLDISLYAEVLVCLYRFLSAEDSLMIFSLAMEPERSDAVKTCVLRACKTIVAEASIFPSQPAPTLLVPKISNRVAEIYKSLCIRKSEVDQSGSMKRSANRPKAKKVSDHGLTDRELMVLAILAMTRSAPQFAGSWMLDDAGRQQWIDAIVRMWDAPFDNAIKVSLAVNSRMTTEGSLTIEQHSDQDEMRAAAFMLDVLPLTTLAIASNLLTCRNDISTQRLWLQMNVEHLALSMMRLEDEAARRILLSPKRIPAFLLSEIALLVTLTSADNDVSQLAAQGLRLISFAERQASAPPNPLMSSEEQSKRIPVYEQLGDPKVIVHGRVLHQKRIRKLLRLTPFSLSIAIAVWEECYWRWRGLTELLAVSTSDDNVARTSDASNVSQASRAQWQNLTLFLSALGGVCLTEPRKVESLEKVIPAKFLPDQIRVRGNHVQMVHTFVKDLTRYLCHDDLQIREVARDALGSELDPKLYGRLISHLDDAMDSISTADISTERARLIGEQSIAVLKLMVDSHQDRMEEMLSVDITTTLQSLAAFLQRSEGGAELARLKIKFCTLCDSTAERPDTLNLKKDSHARHVVLDIVSSWLKPLDDDGTQQADLNLACLRTSVKLLDRLDLKDQEPTNVADDGSHYVTREFSKYFKVLQLGLAVGCPQEIPSSDSVSDVGSIQKRMRASFKEAEVRELVITGLSHLVSSDPEVGLKQCLDLAYGEDHRSRAIFAHVFARVIGQGAKFEALDQVETTDRYKRLADLVKEPNLVLAQAICDTCPTNEIDTMVSVLLNIFNTRTSLMALLKFMITREVTQTENESSLFRSNSIYNRFLSAFAKIQGYNYLRQLILPIVKSMAELPAGQGYELDPSKANGQNLDQNQSNVQFLTTKFLELIFASRAGLPPMFREVCSHIHDTVEKRWPTHKTLRLTAVGGFLFLRFISPAIVAPETIDIDLPNESLRRGLMIIAKIIQNLANNVLFGKEPHMMRLNDYLAENIGIVTEFFSIILREHLVEDDRDEWIGGLGSDDTDGIVMHRFFDKHADKIGKELLSISKPSVDSDPTGVTGKRTWDNLCTLLVDLGTPLEVPRLSLLSSNYHTEYLDLRSRCANRSSASVERLFVPIRRKDDATTALFCYRAFEIDVETIDLELVLSYLFKTIENVAVPFDIIFDCTGFNPKCILPLRWLKYAVEIIPSDFRARLSNTYILNNNMEGQKYMKRVFNFCGGVFGPSIHHVSSVEALIDHIPDIFIDDLGYTASLEHEMCDEFDEATIKVSPLNPNQPAVIRLAVSHVRITCLSPTGAVEIIPMADISDAYVTGLREKNEFIIRRNKQGTTLYLSSPSNDHIVKGIRAAKGRIAENHTSLSDRFSRYSNIPATLLHVGMLNVDNPDEEVRTAAYELLGAVCTYLNYDKSLIVAPEAGFIPGDPSAFVVQLSEKIAEFAPQLTLDFISEVTAAMKMGKSALSLIGQSLGCLYYLSPWVKNLAHFVNPTHPLFDRSASRLRDTIRGLSDLSMSYPELRSPIQKHVWSQIAHLDSSVADIVLDELLRGAVDSGAGTSRCEAHAHIIASFTSIAVRGRLFAKLRKAIIKASPRQTRSLVESHNWNEVSTLSRICLIAGYQTKQPLHNQLYIPEVLHSIMMIAGLGATIVRKSIYGITINLLQSLFMAHTEDSIPNPELLAIMAEVGEDNTLELFGLRRATTTSEYTNYDPPHETTLIEHHERLAKLLVRILKAAAGSTGLLNVWRARWMSLVTSSAFQYSAMIQMRSFTVLGVLATSSLDDDFLYQALVAFSSSLSMMEAHDTLAAVGILRALSKLVPGLPEDTRFLPHLFWMGVAFLQCGYMNFYAEAARLIQITLEVMEQRDTFRTTPVAVYLLDARAHLEEDSLVLDQNLGLSFDTNFTFALAAIIFKGVRRPGDITEAAENLLRTLLRVTMRWRDIEPIPNGHSDCLHPDVLGYFLALLPLSTSADSYCRLLRECHVDDIWLPDAGAASFDDETNVPSPSSVFLGLQDDQTLALFATSFISAILVTAQGDDTETQILYSILSEIATIFPEIVSMAYESLQDRIKDTFANSSNASVIRYVSDIIRVALQDSSRWNTRGSASTLNTIDEGYARLGRNHLSALDEYAMPGLGNHFKFLPPAETFNIVVPHLVRIVDAIAQPNDSQ